jgi:hypothetical protein
VTVQLEKNRSRSRLWLYAALGPLFVIAVAIAWNFYTIRSEARWFVWSQRYKAEVLAQPNATRELKHVEWDGWGWAGQDTTAYLVFDPTDSLSTAARNHRPGKFNGIPCEVPVIDRMERNWYAVRFYTNECWGRRNVLNCTGLGD